MQSYTLSNGVEVVNATPHDLTFATADGTESAARSGAIISAAVVEDSVYEHGVEFARPGFIASVEGAQLIQDIRKSFPGALIIGSLIAAQAYPGEVVAMVAAPGYERVAPADKRMNPAKFTRFNKEAK